MIILYEYACQLINFIKSIYIFLIYHIIFFFGFFIVDWAAVHYGHTTVVGRPMDGRDTLGVDSFVSEHGVHHEGFDGG